MASSDEGEDRAARAFNARAAERYDALAYAPQPEPMLDLEKVLGLGLLYGCGPVGAPEVLDIGCGAGVQLARAAGQTGGRLVGTDISRAACAQAEKMLPPTPDGRASSTPTSWTWSRKRSAASTSSIASAFSMSCRPRSAGRRWR
jgi:SAM-dependent methyltransferase